MNLDLEQVGNSVAQDSLLASSEHQVVLLVMVEEDIDCIDYLDLGFDLDLGLGPGLVALDIVGTDYDSGLVMAVLDMDCMDLVLVDYAGIVVAVQSSGSAHCNGVVGYRVPDIATLVGRIADFADSVDCPGLIEYIVVLEVAMTLAAVGMDFGANRMESLDL